MMGAACISHGFAGAALTMPRLGDSVSVRFCILVTPVAVRFPSIVDRRYVLASSFAGVCASSTSATHAPAEKITSTERVPSFAGDLPGVSSSRALTSKGIDSWRDGFEMLGVYAVPNPAKMVKLEPLQNWADKFLVRNYMRTVRAAKTKRLPFELPIPAHLRGKTSCPGPAGGLVAAVSDFSFGPKSFRQARVTEQCGSIGHIDSVSVGRAPGVLTHSRGIFTSGYSA